MATSTKTHSSKTTFVVLDGGDTKRILRFKGIPPRLRYGFGVVVSPPTKAGSFFVTRWQDLLYAIPKGVSRKNFRRTLEQRKLLNAQDAFLALRQAEHVVRGYGADLNSGEKATLTELENTARELNLAALGSLAGTSITEAQRKLAALAAYFSELMGKPIDLPKREANEQIQVVAKGHDSRRRPNPMALAARTVAARNRIAEREAAVAAIEPHIAARQRRILGLIHRAEYVMNTLDHFLQNLLTDKEWSMVLSGASASAVGIRLSDLTWEMRTIYWNPYREYCLETYKDLRNAQMFLAKQEYEQARNALSTCAHALRLKRIQVELERLIFRLTWRLESDEAVPEEAISSLLDSLGEMRAALTAVDESRFRKPVARNALRYLENATFALNHPEIFHRGGPNQYLKAAREGLKKASAAL